MAKTSTSGSSFSSISAHLLTTKAKLQLDLISAMFTYCRCGVRITEDMNMGRFLIWRRNPKTAFCWKPSLMLRIYWFWSVMNLTSLRPLELASSMSLTTGCGAEGKGGKTHLFTCFLQVTFAFFHFTCKSNVAIVKMINKRSHMDKKLCYKSK